MIFLFLSPQNAISGHLDLMAHIAGIARHPEFCRKLRRTRTREEVQRVLDGGEEELFHSEEEF
ncbi:MAG: hypothetical protein KatS3mg102_2446 [Planctomycetota bacterium]|nr:MAG: hypothetical protein KatS3mg102_2446 [Planctomycetota bacterium]